MEQPTSRAGCRSGSSHCPGATRRRAGRSSWTRVLQVPRDPGRDLPASGGDEERRSELTGMGGQHPAEVCRIDPGPERGGPDGPGYGPDAVGHAELRRQSERHAARRPDAFLGPHQRRHMHAPRWPPRRSTTTRCDSTSGGGDHSGHGPRGPHAAAGPGHLMVFVSDRTTGEPIPYLPASATIRATVSPRAERTSADGRRQGFTRRERDLVRRRAPRSL